MPERLLAFIRPPENASPEAIKRWRWNVALTLLVFWVFAGISVSPFGFVRAQEVDGKIREALNPIQKQIGNVEEKVDSIAGDLDETKRLLIRKLATDLEREIVDAKSRQCKAPSVEAAAYFRGLVLEKQAEYLDLTHREFRVPACAET